MVFFLDYLQHRHDCKFKQAERAQRIQSLSYQSPYTSSECAILSKPVSQLVQDVRSSALTPLSILHAYGKAALKAHSQTNCLTEVMLESSEKWLDDRSIDLRGPLAGIPVSLKDTLVVADYDSTVGYSRNVGNAASQDGGLVRLLKDAGAVPYVKTNCPITLLSFESTNDVWGRCTNPCNSAYSPGGSTGGEAALLALGGSRIGIGSDVAGSVRVPAAWCGIYSLRCSTGRWPKAGYVTSMAGQEGVPSVYSPMARTLDDLTYFTKAILEMKPWKYDCSVHPIPWRGNLFRKFKEKKRFRVGVMSTDGVVPPSPASTRALQIVVDALGEAGHEVIDVSPPSPYKALILGSQLLNSDGCKTFLSPFRTGEWNDLGAAQMAFLMSLLRPIKYLYYLWVKYVRRDSIWAGLVRYWHPKTCYEQWKLVAEREKYRTEWLEYWNEGEYDFLITHANATPAVPHGGMKDAFSSCGYTFLFNVLDYTAAVLPVTHVSRSEDALPADFDISSLNGIAQGAYKHYDAEKMHGLPVGIQLVGRRLEEEKVLAVVERVEELLKEKGLKFEGLDIVE